jgi:hypothetical protein
VLAASVEHFHFGGTASPGSDFSYNPGTANWAAGDLFAKQFPVTVHEDTLDETNETIVLRLTNPSPGLAVGSPSQLIITIVDDDVAGSLAFTLSVYVVREDGASATIAVQRAGGQASGVTVEYATADASATAGEDYVATSGTLTFGAGEAVKTFTVPLIDDVVVEGPEGLTLTLSNPGGGGLLGSPSTAVLVLVDNEIFIDGFESGNTSAWSATVP